MANKVKIRLATPEDDLVIAEHMYKLWRDNQITTDLIRPNWQSITQVFIDRVRQDLAYQAFVAEIDNIIVGSVGCQIFGGLYPNILVDECRRYGYIWGVYVESPYRHQGIGKKLTLQARDYLKSIGCNKAILHASPLGKPVYSSLGFVSSNEMCLDL